MIDLSIRSYEPELMDDFSSEGAVINQTLRELENVNVYLGGNGLSIKALKKIIFASNLKECTIADLGCGGGYTMMHMADWAKKNAIKVQLTGVDANPNIIAFAEKNSVNYKNISYQSKDIFSTYFQNQQFDVIHCSLFTHHFTDEELIALFTIWSKQANTAVIINDLHRHTISYYFTIWVIRALSKSEMVRYDSVLSVKRAFKHKELIGIMEKAGISNYSLKWKWAFRWELIISCGTKSQ